MGENARQKLFVSSAFQSGKETDLTDTVKRIRIAENNHYCKKLFVGKAKGLLLLVRKTFFKEQNDRK